MRFYPMRFNPPFFNLPPMLPRTPLGLININERSSGELTPYQRGIILSLYSQGASFRNIENQYRIIHSTASDTIKFESIRKNSQSIIYPNRPPKYNARVDRRIIRYIRIIPKSIYKQIYKALQILLSNNTIVQIL